MLSIDDYQREAFETMWCLDPKTRRMKQVCKWHHDETTGEYFRVVSMQPTGPELQQFTYAERRLWRIAQERDVNNAIEDKRGGGIMLFVFDFFGLIFLQFPLALFIIFLVVSGLLLWSARRQMAEGFDKLTDLGPEPTMPVISPKTVKRMQTAAERNNPTSTNPFKHVQERTYEWE